MWIKFQSEIPSKAEWSFISTPPTQKRNLINIPAVNLHRKTFYSEVSCENRQMEKARKVFPLFLHFSTIFREDNLFHHKIYCVVGISRF